VSSCAIFDMDGVLIDSGAHHRHAWRALLAELGTEPADPEHWRLTIGRPSEEAIPLLLNRRMSGAEARRLARRKRDLYQERAQAGLEPVRSLSTSLRVLAWSLAQWLAVALAVYGCAAVVGFAVGFAATCLVVVGIVVAFLLPNAPGYDLVSRAEG